MMHSCLRPLSHARRLRFLPSTVTTFHRCLVTNNPDPKASSVIQSKNRRRRRQRGDDEDGGIPFENLLPGIHRKSFQPTHSDGKSKSIDEYLEEASLSPWVPTPDPVGRRMLQIANAGSDDIHYELGSGDGRLNFLAIDAPFYVKRSVGIEIDLNLLQSANERLSKRHPLPDLKFVHADLLPSPSKKDEITSDTDKNGEDDPVDLSSCTVLTMYFVEEALQKLKPMLERQLGGTGCRIVTNGYEMVGWEAEWVEKVLDLPIYLYVMRDQYDKEDDDQSQVLSTPSVLPDQYQEGMEEDGKESKWKF